MGRTSHGQTQRFQQWQPCQVSEMCATLLSTYVLDAPPKRSPGCFWHPTHWWCSSYHCIACVSSSCCNQVKVDTALATTRVLLVHAVWQGSPEFSGGVRVVRRLPQSCLRDAAPHASLSFKAPLWVWAQEGKLHLDEVRKEAMGPHCAPTVALYRGRAVGHWCSPAWSSFEACSWG